VASQASIDDTFLVGEVQNGNREAFEELVRHHDRAIFRLAFRITGSESDAQDVYQETFLRAYSKLGGFRYECGFSTWIYRIATNLCLEYLRKKHRRPQHLSVATADSKQYDLLDTLPADRSTEPDTACTCRELRLRIHKALQKLTPRERVVIELKHHHGLKLCAIGDMISANEQAVKYSLARATRKLRAELADLR